MFDSDVESNDRVKELKSIKRGICMNQIEAFGGKYTANQYIKEMVTASRGGRSSCSKKELEELCISANIKPAWNDTKTKLYDKLINEGNYTGKLLAEKFHIGVTGRAYVRAFCLSPKAVMQMAEKGFLHIVGYNTFMSCGKKVREPFFDVYEFESMTNEKIELYKKKL